MFKKMKRFLVISSLFIVLLLLPATSYEPGTVYAHAQISVVEMTAEGFKPQSVTVDKNSIIIFINKDVESRWPASNTHPTHDLYPEFDPKKPIEPGASWTFKPKKTGEYKYHDHLFPHMRGSLVVVAENDEEQKPEQTSSPHSMWEYGLNFFSEVKKKITALFKFNKKTTLPEASKFVNLSYQEQQRILESEDAQKAWEFVKTTFKGQGGSSGNIHDLAHLSGKLLYDDKGFEGIRLCSANFAFGCYHGFLDAAFAKSLDHLLDAQDACLKLGPENSGPVASCIHGIGHGVASYYQVNDLNSSLGSCRKLSSGREYCFDGVFMEFVRNAPDSFFQKDDYLYPCNKLESQFGAVYSFACGRNQPSLLMGRFNLGFEEVVGICLQSDSRQFKEACFDSLGFSVASSGDVQKIIANCQTIGIQEHILRCIKAAAGELVFQEVPGWYEKSQAVCQAFESGKDNCLEHIDRLIREYNKQVQMTFPPKKADEDLNLYLRNQLKRCYGTGGRDSCYKQVAQAFYSQFGLSQILQTLKLNEDYPEVYARCHEVTHYLSRFEYEKQKNIAKVYAQCDSTCHGGCYHGTMEAFLKEKEGEAGNNLAKEFAKICSKTENYSRPLEFNECLHGLGHAAMFVTEMELKESLALCDTLGEKKFIERCYTGVFMENSSSSTSFDHKSIYIKADDPFYPCNALEEKYQSVCWQYQSSYFSILNGQNWAKVTQMCLQIPASYQDKCFRTIGTNQVGFSSSLQTMKDGCDHVPAHFKNICIAGVISSLSYRFVDNIQKMSDFCALVDVENKESCYKQMGSSILEWDNDKNLARKNCSLIFNDQGSTWCQSVI